MAIALVVNFTVAKCNENKAKELMRIMEGHTRKEPGSQIYIGHQSKENPLQFLFYELYDNEAALDAHNAAPYFKEYVLDGLLPMMETKTFEKFDTFDSTAAKA